MKNELKELSNPKKYDKPISIKNQDIGSLKRMLKAFGLGNRMKMKTLLVSMKTIQVMIESTLANNY